MKSFRFFALPYRLFTTQNGPTYGRVKIPNEIDLVRSSTRSMAKKDRSIAFRPAFNRWLNYESDVIDNVSITLIP